MRALVIDDSRAVRLIIGQYLRETGLEVLEAKNGREALEQLERNPDVELMLLDWNMPEMNGFDFLRAVRSQRTYDAVRILMVTSGTQVDYVAWALKAGADEYLMKPFNKDVLVAKLSLLNVLPERFMSKFRVLIVDDAVVFRRLLAEEAARDPALDVVGTAANGRIALARLPQVNPDVVILDVEMPEMDGLTALAELRKTYRHLPVIMFSSLTERGAEATLDALTLGATDYFTKPANVGGLDASLAVIREQLIPKIKAVCARAGGQTGSRHDSRPAGLSSTATGSRPDTPSPHRPKAQPGPVQVVAIGASTGGPNALTDVFRRLPANFPVPLVIVQHMPPLFTRLLAERLSAQFSIRVQEGCPGSELQPGQAPIAPGDHHMTVVREGTQVRLQLHQGPPENSCRPAVDVLLRSVAQAYGPNSLAVILTGMGQDGLRGCEAIRAAGGHILAQDEATSVVWGMPGYVVRAGLADQVLPLSLIGDEILRQVQNTQVPR